SAYLTYHADPETTQAAFDRCYQSNRDRLAAQLVAVLDTVDGTDGTGTVAFVPEWLSLVHGYRDRADELIASRAISFDHLADQPLASTQPEAQSRRPTTVVDRLGANEAWQREIGESDWFSRHRLVLNYQYLLLNRLGITPSQRYLLCHLAASTVQEGFRVSAAATFEEFMAAPPNPGDPHPPARAPQPAQGT